MSKISAQPSGDFIESVVTEPVELPRTPSESTFTRHTKSVHAIIKEVIMGIIYVLQIYVAFKLTK